MATVRYQATHVVTQDEDDRWLSPGVVEVTDGRITWVGPPEDAPEQPPQDAPEDPQATPEQLDGMLLPGFVNTHAHSPMVLVRGAGEGLPVDRWLAEAIWPREARLTSDDVRVGMMLGAAQLLRNGYTTSCEMYFRADEVAAGARAVGLRCLVASPILVTEGLDALGPWQEQLDEVAAFADAHRDDDLVDGVVGPHAAYTVPEAALREIGRLAVDRDLLVTIHVAETEHEGDRILEQHGVTVPAYLDRLGVLEARVLAAHGVWLTDDDVALFAERRVGVAHCPASNAKHASGIAPVVELRAAGVPVGIATDGPVSHDRLDPFEEMRTAIRLARLRAGDAATLGPRDVLRMVTREAAAALGRDDLGAIEAGRRADLVLVRVDPTVLSPVVACEDLLTHLVWSGTPALVDRVWVGGREVVRDGVVTTIDVEDVAADVTRRARRLATP